MNVYMKSILKVLNNNKFLLGMIFLGIVSYPFVDVMISNKIIEGNVADGGPSGVVGWQGVLRDLVMPVMVLGILLSFVLPAGLRGLFIPILIIAALFWGAVSYKFSISPGISVDKNINWWKWGGIFAVLGILYALVTVTSAPSISKL